MKRASSADTPEDFIKRVHHALRAWHAQNAEEMLDDLLLAQRLQAERQAPPRLISNQILLNGIERLKQTSAEAADLLQRRFLDQETAQEVSYRRNLSEDIVFQRQRLAIAQLAEIIWNQEQELRQEQRRRIETRLESPTYTQLFGVADKLTEVRLRLETTTEPWLVSIEGLGGIGKTSLADAAVRELAGGRHFREIAWVSARRRLFQLSGEIEPLNHFPDLTFTELVDRCIDQFELASLRRQADSEKLAGLKDFLKAQTCLIVVDNLESAANHQAFVSQVMSLVNPSKVLFTSRYSLRDVSGVSILTLKQLTRKDTLALVRHEAQTRGLPELAQVSEKELGPIYEVTGGNPLATKLIVGQIHTLSLPTALARFSQAKGKPVEELLDYLYAAAWQVLDDPARQVLQAMLLVTEEGGRVEQIAAATELDEHTVASCLHRLATLSLVNVGGTLQERRYALHQLTQAFVTQQAANDSM